MSIFDSDEDADYVPPPDIDSDVDEPDAKRARVDRTITPTKEEQGKKKARERLWAEFQDSALEPATQRAVNLVKIEKRRLFAGEDLLEVVEVDENSEDAKKWPRWRSPPIEATHLPTSSSTSTSTVSSKDKPTRPGPRKSKVALPLLSTGSSQKPQKMTTLDKSAMDWREHLNASQDSHQVEANRKGSGYLDKVEFLQRVEARKETFLDTSKAAKRRRLP